MNFLQFVQFVYLTTDGETTIFVVIRFLKLICEFIYMMIIILNLVYVNIIVINHNIDFKTS